MVTTEATETTQLKVFLHIPLFKCREKHFIQDHICSQSREQF